MTEDKPGQCRLPNGCTLYWEPNGIGGRRYFSDEIGGGVLVWDTSLVDSVTLLAAIVQDSSYQTEMHYKEKKLLLTKDEFISDNLLSVDRKTGYVKFELEGKVYTADKYITITDNIKVAMKKVATKMIEVESC